MSIIFNNAFEMAHYFFERNTDEREWGEVRPFYNTEIYHYYFWDMQDKYVRGHNMMDSIRSEEYRKAKYNAFSAMIDYINYNTSYTFPCEYSSKCTYADGRSTEFKVIVTPISQITFRQLGIDYTKNPIS